MKIQPYSPEYQDAVIALWQKCHLVRPNNNPQKDIQRKLKVNPELFLIGLLDGKVVATGMGGYEGHRGWVNYLGVDPAYRHKGYARQLMNALEAMLLERGCPKLNLQVLADNRDAMIFYERIGYKRDEVVSMGKRLIPD
ncbi:MAG: GNAT family acetyltransferase [Dehalococcoidales bacterium]|nr:GNAT family acetyltransferase [Dehalococcoidales bacterium]